MSALRVGQPGRPSVLLPVDDGMAPYRGREVDPDGLPAAVGVERAFGGPGEVELQRRHQREYAARRRAGQERRS